MAKDTAAQLSPETDGRCRPLIAGLGRGPAIGKVVVQAWLAACAPAWPEAATLTPTAS